MEKNIPCIELCNVKKYFKMRNGTLHAVDGINVEIEEGTTLGVVGESGCGKSTLGRVTLNLLPATEGEVKFYGEKISQLSQRKMANYRKQMSLIFQDPYSSLDPRKTMAEIVEEPLKIYRMCTNKQDRREKVVELLRTVGLAERYSMSYAHELDGGRRQRVGIARALAVDPKFIVCDEPVSALDVSIQAQILNLLMDLQQERGLTYMFVTHNLSVVKHISNKIMVMYLGQCVEIAQSSELFANPVHPYTKALMAAIPLPTMKGPRLGGNVIRGELTSPIDPKPGCRFYARCPYATKKCAEQDVPLRDIGGGHVVSCTLCGN